MQVMLRSKFVRVIILCFAVMVTSVYGSPKRASGHSYTAHRIRRAGHHQNCRNTLPSPWYENSIYWEPSTIRNHRDLEGMYYSLMSPDYVSPYIPYGRASRSKDSSTFPSNVVPMIAFDAKDAHQHTNSYPVENYEAIAPSTSMMSSKHHIEGPFQIIESEIDSSEYEVAPSRTRRLYVVPRADVDPLIKFEDDSDTNPFSITVPRSAPQVYKDHPMIDSELEDIVKKAITTTRHQRQHEEALYHTETNPKKCAEQPRRRSPARILKPSDIVYTPEITYNPYNLPSQLNIVKMLEMNAHVSDQRDSKLNSDMAMDSIQTDKSVEENGPRQKDSIGNEKEIPTMDMPNVSFGEDVLPIKTRDIVRDSTEDFNGKINMDASDDKLDGDVVLSEILQEGENLERSAKSVDSLSAVKKNDELSSAGDLDLLKNAVNSTPISPESTQQSAVDQSSDTNNKDQMSA